MGYFNPLVYFIKSFIRVFVKKFFYIVLIFILLLIFLFIFKGNIFAETINGFTYGSDADIYVLNNMHYLYEKCKTQYNITNDNINYIVLGGLNDNSIVTSFFIIFVNPDGGDVTYSTLNNWTKDWLYVKHCYTCSPRIQDNPFNAIYTYNSVSDITEGYFDYWTSNSYNTVFQKKDKVVVLYSSYNSGQFASDHKLDLSNIPTLSTYFPYFVTTDRELKTFDFDYFKISGGHTPYYTELAPDIGGNSELVLTYDYDGVTTTIDVSSYLKVDDSTNTWEINIPRTALTNNVIIRNGKTFSYTLKYIPFYRKSKSYYYWRFNI